MVDLKKERKEVKIKTQQKSMKTTKTDFKNNFSFKQSGGKIDTGATGSPKQMVEDCYMKKSETARLSGKSGNRLVKINNDIESIIGKR